MSAGRADGVDRNDHAWAGNVAAADGIAQSDVQIIVRSDVTNARKASHQRDTRVHAGIQRLFCDCFLQQIELALLPVVGIHRGFVRVRVDESRQQRGIAKIDDLGARGNGGACSDSGNFPVGHDHQTRAHQRIALPVEKARCFQHEDFARRLLGGSCRRNGDCGTKNENSEPSASHEFSLTIVKLGQTIARPLKKSRIESLRSQVWPGGDCSSVVCESPYLAASAGRRERAAVSRERQNPRYARDDILYGVK